MTNTRKEIKGRPLTQRETTWIREILRTHEEWKDADISCTQVIEEMPCDEGLSLLLGAPEPETRTKGERAGYIGGIWINNDDGTTIEVRLIQSERQLHERFVLFVLFVDPKRPNRPLPESWTEVSHESYKL